MYGSKLKHYIKMIGRIAFIIPIMMVAFFFAPADVGTSNNIIDLQDIKAYSQLEPSGSYVHKGNVRLRFDLFLKQDAPGYDIHYVYVVDATSPEYQAGYPGEVDKEGNPIDQKQYDQWVDGLPHVWRNNPFVCVFVSFDPNDSDALIKAKQQEILIDSYNYWIDNDFNLRKLDKALDLDKSVGSLTPQNLIECDARVTDIIDRKHEFEVNETKLVSFHLGAVFRVFAGDPIDVGPGAINRNSSGQNTYVPFDNPANATGTIDTWELWFAGASADNVEVATFYVVSGDNLSTRDSELIGSVATGSKQTFSGKSTDVTAGDYAGVYPGTGWLETSTNLGTGYWWKSGDNVPCTNTAFTNNAGTYSNSVYATGETGNGVVAPTVTSDNSTLVEETTATLAGNITATGGENADYRGFEWGTSTGSYSANTTDSGNFSTGIYSANITSLSPGTTYYWRAMAHNSGGWGYGGELYFTTKPQAPTVLQDTARTSSQITLTWTKGTGSENTTIVYKTAGYPTGPADGTVVYDNTASTCNMTGDSPGHIHYISAYAVNTDNQTIYSDSASQDIAYTLPGDASNASTSNATKDSLDLEWTEGTGGDKTHWRWKTGSYPTGVSDGTQAFFNTGNLTTVTSLPANTQIYLAGWPYDSDSSYYSGNATQTTGTTLLPDLPTVATSNATGVGSTYATLHGNITDTGGQNCDERGFEWGASPGVYTDNWTDSGSFGTGAFSHQITSLNATTSYWFRPMAHNDKGWAYGTEDGFTTVGAGEDVPGTPTGLVLTQVTTNEINATWNPVDNVTAYLLMVSTTAFPNNPLGPYMVAYAGNLTSVNLVGYDLERTAFLFSLWAQRNPYSNDYATAEIGDETLAEEMSGLTDATLLIFEVMLALGILGFAMWKKDIIFYLIAGLVVCFVSLSWINQYPAITIPVLTLGLYQIGTGVLLALTGGRSNGLSYFKEKISKLSNKIKSLED